MEEEDEPIDYVRTLDAQEEETMYAQGETSRGVASTVEDFFDINKEQDTIGEQESDDKFGNDDMSRKPAQRAVTWSNVVKDFAISEDFRTKKGYELLKKEYEKRKQVFDNYLMKKKQKDPLAFKEQFRNLSIQDTYFKMKFPGDKKATIGADNVIKKIKNEYPKFYDRMVQTMLQEDDKWESSLYPPKTNNITDAEHKESPIKMLMQTVSGIAPSTQLDIFKIKEEDVKTFEQLVPLVEAKYTKNQIMAAHLMRVFNYNTGKVESTTLHQGMKIADDIFKQPELAATIFGNAMRSGLNVSQAQYNYIVLGVLPTKHRISPFDQAKNLKSYFVNRMDKLKQTVKNMPMDEKVRKFHIVGSVYRFQQSSKKDVNDNGEGWIARDLQEMFLNESGKLYTKAYIKNSAYWRLFEIHKKDIFKKDNLSSLRFWKDAYLLNEAGSVKKFFEIKKSQYDFAIKELKALGESEDSLRKLKIEKFKGLHKYIELIPKNYELEKKFKEEMRNWDPKDKPDSIWEEMTQRKAKKEKRESE